ncbi:interferon gamma-like [Siniperca chuatsi]|uniref:Interferon gamma n=1 Tax=Siniperca chuatsi TaxID=119488 RepID=A0A516AFI2_SINCH|nr:interferon gamma-like [Siniperca chuatsi]QDO15115.1 interferon gamma [Siniperca chuatsi]
MVAMARAVVCLSLWLCVCQISGFHMPEKINRTIQNLLQHYKIPPKERFNGRPVFSREPLAGKTEAKMVFMGGVLETYEKLIGHMLKQQPTSSPQTAGNDQRPASAVTPAASTASDAEAGAGGKVRMELSYILKKIQDLRKHNYHEQEKLLKGLQALNHIQMDNFVVQSKALWELPWLYEEASSLTENIRMQRRRRRRQARRVKNRPRA